MTEYVRITDRKIELTDEGVEALMTDYTPTTEEVRDAFSDYNEDVDGGWYEAEAQFYRWLAEVKAQAWEEGFQGGYDSAMGVGNIPNPYRQES